MSHRLGSLGLTLVGVAWVAATLAPDLADHGPPVFAVALWASTATQLLVLVRTRASPRDPWWLTRVR